MKRIEARDLLPGDEFEYEYTSRYSRPQTQVKRDRVKPLSGGYWKIQQQEHLVNEEGEFSTQEGTLVIYTEVGQTNHHYVNVLRPNTVVVLISREEKSGA